MSDVAVAPDAGGAAAPASNEVTINQEPVSLPNPIGAQAPPAPTGDIEGSKHRPPSRREALQAAFDRAVNPQPKTERHVKPEAKAAEAKIGHNNPPEKTEKFDLKKRPTEQQAPQSRERDEGGKFTPRQPEGNAEWQQLAKPRDQQNGQPQAQQPATSYRDPPSRMSEQAKRDWNATPETVRGDIHRQHQEFAKAYNYYKDAHTTYKTIEPYHQLAQQQGTTLAKALENYTEMEKKLLADPLGGLDVLIQNLNLKRPDGGKADLRDVAYTILSQTPEQLKAIQQGNVQQAANQQIGALHQQIAQQQDVLNQIIHQTKFTYTRSMIDQFAASHPRFDELSDLIEAEINLGFNLDTAYRRAELLRPTTHAAQTRTTSAQTRPAADKSIHGSPAALNGATRRPQQASKSSREAVEKAMGRLNGL